MLWLQKFFTLIEDNIFMPDTMQEFCRKHRYDFSKHYLNKFITVPASSGIGIFSSYLDHEVYEYLKHLRIVDKHYIIKKIKWLDSLHDILLHDNSLIKLLSSIKGMYIYTYKQSCLTDVLSKRTWKLLPNISKKIQYLSDKKNLYKIFNEKLLPKKYTLGNLESLDKNKEIIIKPRVWSNSRWVFLIKNRYIKEYVTANNIDVSKYIFQEYIQTKTSYSITLLCADNVIYPLFFCYLPIKILYEWFLRWFYAWDSFYSPVFLAKNAPYYDIIQNEIKKKVKFFKWISLFNVEFIVSKSKKVKIIEINPRIPASLAMASCISKLSRNNCIDITHYFISNKSCVHDMFKKYHIINILKKYKILYEYDKWEGILPLNFSKKFARADYLVIWKNKANYDKIENIFLSIIKK